MAKLKEKLVGAKEGSHSDSSVWRVHCAKWTVRSGLICWTVLALAGVEFIFFTVTEFVLNTQLIVQRCFRYC